MAVYTAYRKTCVSAGKSSQVLGCLLSALDQTQTHVNMNISGIHLRLIFMQLGRNVAFYRIQPGHFMHVYVVWWSNKKSFSTPLLLLLFSCEVENVLQNTHATMPT